MLKSRQMSDNFMIMKQAMHERKNQIHETSSKINTTKNISQNPFAEEDLTVSSKGDYKDHAPRIELNIGVRLDSNFGGFANSHVMVNRIRFCMSLNQLAISREVYGIARRHEENMSEREELPIWLVPYKNPGQETCARFNSEFAGENLHFGPTIHNIQKPVLLNTKFNNPAARELPNSDEWKLKMEMKVEIVFS